MRFFFFLFFVVVFSHGFGVLSVCQFILSYNLPVLDLTVYLNLFLFRFVIFFNLTFSSPQLKQKEVYLMCLRLSAIKHCSNIYLYVASSTEKYTCNKVPLNNGSD